MRPEECLRLDGCSKVRMILDKDMEDFQFVETLREVCARCTDANVVQMNTANPEKMQIEVPKVVGDFLFETLYADIAEADGDIELSRQLRARIKLRLLNMSDDRLLAFVIAITPHEQNVESVYEKFQKARIKYVKTVNDWMKGLPKYILEE